MSVAGNERERECVERECRMSVGSNERERLLTKSLCYELNLYALTRRRQLTPYSWSVRITHGVLFYFPRRTRERGVNEVTSPETTPFDSPCTRIHTQLIEP
jgi:hypothetical protein